MNDERARLIIVDDAAAVAHAVAETVVEESNRAIAARGLFALALAGGSTPKAAYALLASPAFRDRVAWSNTRVFFGDERCVPPDDDRSNYHMAAHAFLNSVPIPPENIHRMRGEDDPPTAARAYAAELQATLGDTPTFDLMLLGMGPDGHTASLFPGSDPTTDDEALVRAVYVDKLESHRLTLTPRVINASRCIVVATEGIAKAPALYAVLRGPHDPTVHPIQIVRPNGVLNWIVDRAAAAEFGLRA